MDYEQLNEQELDYLINLVKEEKSFLDSSNGNIDEDEFLKKAIEVINGEADELPDNIKSDPKMIKVFDELKALKDLAPKDVFEGIVGQAVEATVPRYNVEKTRSKRILVVLHDKLHLMKSLL